MDVRFHPYEEDRLASLESYEVVGRTASEAVEAVTRLAAALCDAPVSLINLIDADRYWCLATCGAPLLSGPREEAVCSDVVASSAALAVPDLRAEPRYACLPYVADGPQLRSYAGVPLIGRDGLPVGTLCVLDTEARVYSGKQLEALADLAVQVMTALELRRWDAISGLVSPGLVPEARQPVTLRRALDNHEFVPHFQPVVDMRSRRVVGLEALIRWQHPTRGLLTPDAFLPGLENTSLVTWSGYAVLEAACRLTVDLQAVGMTLPGGIAINVSGRQMARPGLAARVIGALERYELPGSALTAELTETAEVVDVQLVAAELTALREAGVRVVADDFGVGWSNLVRLLQLPLSGLKIDKELVTTMVGDAVRDHMVAATVDLAAAMGLGLIAEGVETEVVRSRLLALGCRYGQGWLFGHAVPAADVPALLDVPRLRAS